MAMKQYQVERNVKHGVKKGSVAQYKRGATIELDEKDPAAAELLAIGAISAFPEPAKKAEKEDDKKDEKKGDK